MAARRPAPPPPTTSTSHVNRSMTLYRDLVGAQSTSMRLERGVRGAFVTAVGHERPNFCVGPLEWSARSTNGCPRTRARDIVPPGGSDGLLRRIGRSMCNPGG